MKLLMCFIAALALAVTTWAQESILPPGGVIGRPTGGTPYDMLFVDSSGNLGEDNANLFSYEPGRGLYMLGSPVTALMGGLYIGPDESTLYPSIQNYALGTGESVGVTCNNQYTCLGIEAEASTIGYSFPLYMVMYQLQGGQPANAMESDAVVVGGSSGSTATGIIGYGDVETGTIDIATGFYSESQCLYGGACLIDQGYLADDQEGGINGNYSYHSKQAPGTHNYSFYAEGGAPVVVQRASGQTEDLLDLLDTNGSTALSKFDVNGNLYIVAQKSTTGQRYVCVTTAGELVSSTTACSGT